jgi:hypothetical protein
MSDVVQEELMPAPGEDELPILEVLRHADAAPIAPEPETIAADEQPQPEEAQAVLPGIVEEPEPSDQAALDAEPPALEDSGAEAAEPVEEPRIETPSLPPEPAPVEPVRHYSDFDFMAEEEEDPIGSFWEAAEEERRRTPPSPEQPAVPSETGPVEALAPDDAEPDAEIVADEAPSFSPPTEEVTIRAAEEMHPPAAEAPPERGHASQPDADEDTVPFFRPLGAAVDESDSADRAQPLREPSGPEFDRPDLDETIEVVEESPPWVTAEAEPEPAKSPPSRVVLAAVASAAVIVAAVALAGRADRGATIMSTDVSQPAAAAKSEARAAQPAAGKTEAGPAKGPAASPRQLPPPSAPLLPGRETAFVTASVLQCRSTPTEGSEPVRKLVRGSEVQILARDDGWSSVAHRGRQCWAATRFLSAVQPW